VNEDPDKDPDLALKIKADQDPVKRLKKNNFFTRYAVLCLPCTENFSDWKLHLQKKLFSFSKYTF
jgi:hypothetical protein